MVVAFVDYESKSKSSVVFACRKRPWPLLKSVLIRSFTHMSLARMEQMVSSWCETCVKAKECCSNIVEIVTLGGGGRWCITEDDQY